MSTDHPHNNHNITAEDFAFEPHKRLTHTTLRLFLEGFANYLGEMESELQHLDNALTDEQSINGLFRAMHNLKGDCFICYLTPLGKYVHAIEDSLTGLQSGQLQYNALLKESLLIALDLIPSAAESMVSEHTVNTELFAEVAQNFYLFTLVPRISQNEVCQKIITCLGGMVAPLATEKAIERDDLSVQSQLQCWPAKADNDYRRHQEQLAYFCSLSTVLESRNPRWQERTCTIACVAMEINQQLNLPVDEDQLEAAIYLHDVGMAFFSDEVLESISYRHPENDRQILVHTQVGAQMLQLLPDWHVAGEIVLQHHERFDGSGYPLRLKGEDICLGARILSLAIYYDALVQGRDPIIPRCSAVRAAAEVTAGKGGHFDPVVVEALNQMTRSGFAEYARNKLY